MTHFTRLMVMPNAYESARASDRLTPSHSLRPSGSLPRPHGQGLERYESPHQRLSSLEIAECSSARRVGCCEAQELVVSLASLAHPFL